MDHKEAELQRIDAFELWYWRQLLRITWIARRSNQSIINPKYSLEGLMLKLQYFGLMIQRTDSLEKSLILKKTETRGEEVVRGLDDCMASLMQWT